MTENNVRDNDLDLDNDGVEDTNSVDTHKEGNTVTVDLYDANHGKAPRTGGPYLDDVEKHNAETWRAQQENREPDYDNPPAVVSTVLVPESQLRERDVDKNHFNEAVKLENKPVTSYEADTTDGFSGDPDPTQPNFDNNYDRLNALNAGTKLSELKDKAGDKAPNAQPASAPTESLKEHPNTEAMLNKPNYSQEEKEDGAEVTPTETWDNPGATGDGVNR